MAAALIRSVRVPLLSICSWKKWHVFTSFHSPQWVHVFNWSRQAGNLYTVHVSGAHTCLSETGRCQQRNCFRLLTRLDHCSYENRTLPGSPRAPLSFPRLWHMFICVSLTCVSCCARTGAVAFDPGRQREEPSTHEEDTPRPQAEGSLRGWFVSWYGARSTDMIGVMRLECKYSVTVVYQRVQAPVLHSSIISYKVDFKAAIAVTLFALWSMEPQNLLSKNKKFNETFRIKNYQKKKTSMEEVHSFILLLYTFFMIFYSDKRQKLKVILGLMSS